MSTKHRVRRFIIWPLLWVGGVVLVVLGMDANAHYENDRTRVPLRSGVTEAVAIDPSDRLAIYAPIGSSYARCAAVSPDLTIHLGVGWVRPH